MLTDVDMHFYINGCEWALETEQQIRQAQQFLDTALLRAPKPKAASRRRPSRPSQPVQPAQQTIFSVNAAPRPGGSYPIGERLRDYAETALREAGRPMSDAELAGEALRRGWRSASTDAGNSVRTTLRTAADMFVKIGAK